jgi:septum formation protein
MLILASTSETRRAMLENAGLSFRSEKPDVDETALVAAHPDWTPQITALQLAEAKAINVSRRHQDAIVIGADQVLALGNKIYSKPSDLHAAKRQLSELRNHQHHLISAVVCASNAKAVWHAIDQAALTMRDFSEDFLDEYLAANGGKTMTSVGGYQVEGLGIQLFEQMEGNHFTILGLPLLSLLHYLRTTGAISS